MSTPSLVDDGKRPIEAYCFNERSEQTFNSDGDSYKPEYQCTFCGKKTCS